MQNPTVTLNTPAQSRHQVPLRDYLNTRIAPFLKKALTESLDKEPEYPLQWLGECLINQSILYEGNAEAEKLKERFRYTFPDPQPEPQPEQHVPVVSTHPSPQPASRREETNGVPELPQAEPQPQPQPQTPAPAPAAAAQKEVATINGQETTANANTITTASESVEASLLPSSSEPTAAVQSSEMPPVSGTAAASLPPPIDRDGQDTEMSGTT